MNTHRCRLALLLGLGVALAGTGCSSNSSRPDLGDTGFLAYEGKQARWPTAENALVDRSHAVPVYRGLPPRPYAIVGRITGTQSNVIGRGLAEAFWSDRDRLANVCAQARLQGADAVLLTEDPQLMEALRVPRGETGEKERPLYDYGGAVVAIKWSVTP